MPKYLVCDRDKYYESVVAEVNVSDPRAAIEAVDPTIKLPEKVAVIDGEHVTKMYVIPKNGGIENVVMRGDVQEGMVALAAGPPPPKGLVAKASTGGTRATLTWVQNSPAPQGYRVYRNDKWIGTVPTADTYIDLTTTAGNTYKYQVAAVDDLFVEGAKTDAVTVTT